MTHRSVGRKYSKPCSIPTRCFSGLHSKSRGRVGHGGNFDEGSPFSLHFPMLSLSRKAAFAAARSASFDQSTADGGSA
jgi:hypothetical protein